MPDLAGRELLEEAGAVAEGPLHLFSAHAADSARPTPYRPHLPHPRAYWAYGVVDVRVDSSPTNPDGGETVVGVVTMPPVEAPAHLQQEEPIHADVLRHAGALGLV